MSEPIFIVREKYTRVDCDLPGWEGFWIEVRQNLAQWERTALIEALEANEDRVHELQDAMTEWARETDAAMAATDDPAEKKRLRAAIRAFERQYPKDLEAILAERFPLIVPHVRAWNLFARGDDGEPVPLPPPCEGGVEVLVDLDRDLVWWMARQILTAYRGGKSLSGLSTTRDESQPLTSASPSAGPQVTAEPDFPASPAS